MQNFASKIKTLSLVFLICISCVEPYEPPVVENNISILIVDGSLNTQGKSLIRLTRSQNIAEVEKTPVLLELNALVSFEDENGGIYKLLEEGKGNYGLPPQTFDRTKKYRVTIQTIDSKEYESEFIPIVKNPPIDSITWTVTSDNGVQLYLNTHDFENDTRYYRWAYEESWKYLSAYNSNFEWKNGKPVLRGSNNNIYICYQTKNSGEIAVGSAAHLSQAIIHDYPLLYIEQRSDKIRLKYSILVKQYGLTKEAYEYWQQLQKNTENLGTLFDPQPSQLTGNIKCVSDTSEPVIGYFIAGSVSEKRIFINSDLLPRASTYITPFAGCSADTLAVRNIPQLRSKDLLNILLLDPLPSGPGAITAYSTTTAACADCRTAGGTTTKPDFWQ